MIKVLQSSNNSGDGLGRVGMDAEGRTAPLKELPFDLFHQLAPYKCDDVELRVIDIQWETQTHLA